MFMAGERPSTVSALERKIPLAAVDTMGQRREGLETGVS